MEQKHSMCHIPHLGDEVKESTIREFLTTREMEEK